MTTRRSSEAGFVMPVVIAISLVLLLLTAVAVTTALSAGDAANRDRRVKTARQTADAGLELALFRLNAVIAGEAQPCATQDASGNLTLTGYAAGGEWCPPVEDVAADGSRTRYWVSKSTPVAGSSPPLYDRKVVAEGEYLGQRRRVYAEIQARQGVAGFGVYGISAVGKITFQNEAQAGFAPNFVDVRTNGDIELKDGSYVCGNVTPGPGKTVTGASGRVCPGKSTAPATLPLDFPNYDAEHTAARTTNDNARLGCTGTPPKDACTSSSDVLWDSTRRELTVQGNASLTLGGNVYSLCRLNLKGDSRLTIAARAANAPPLKIYFGAPNLCNNTSEPIMIENGVGITNVNLAPVTLQLFVRGSSTFATKVNFKNNISGTEATPMMIYAPNSEVLLENSASFMGGLVGKTVELKNDVTFVYDPNAAAGTGTALVYQPMTSRECSPVAPGAPETGC
jgi:hypothetical protein